MARSNEPLWWGPFAAGMIVGALFVPALIVITGLLWPLFRPGEGDVVRRLITHPVTKLFLVVVISLSLFHWAHRFRYILFDLGLKGGKTTVAAVCYSGAVAGTLVVILIACGLL